MIQKTQTALFALLFTLSASSFMSSHANAQFLYDCSQYDQVQCNVNDRCTWDDSRKACSAIPLAK